MTGLRLPEITGDFSCDHVLQWFPSVIADVLQPEPRAADVYSITVELILT
jgi:hypothetical protein